MFINSMFHAALIAVDVTGIVRWFRLCERFVSLGLATYVRLFENDHYSALGCSSWILVGTVFS